MIYNEIMGLLNTIRLGDDPKPPDFTPLITLVKAYGLAVLAAILAIIAVIGIFFLVKLGFKIMRSSDDPEARSNAVHAIIWWAAGFGITFTASIVSGVFAAIFFQK